MDAADHEPEPGARRVGGQVAERRPALEHRIGRRTDATDLEEVVHDPDRVEADVVGDAGDAGEGRPDRRRSTGEVERGDLQAELHRESVASVSGRGRTPPG